MHFICSMRSLGKFFLAVLLLPVFICKAKAQIADTSVTRKLYQAKDSIRAVAEPNPAFKETDSIKLKNLHAHDPRKAAIRSAILPGWGQAYNKKYWKIPIVYAALGATGWYFFDNLKYYKQLRLGYSVAYRISQKNDSTGYNKITDTNVKLAVDQGNRLEQLQFYRDKTRREVDYAALYFMIAWALNVLEASVDAHLSSFDISPDLTLKLQPGFSDMAKTNGLSLVLKFK